MPIKEKKQLELAIVRKDKAFNKDSYTRDSPRDLTRAKTVTLSKKVYTIWGAKRRNDR